MRTTTLAAAIVLGSIAVARSAGAPAAAAAPCVTATSACAEFVTLGGGPGRSMVYRTYPLDTRNDAMRRALIMVHGTNRNADHYFETSIAAAFLAGALEDTVVIAPHMIDQTDKPAENEIVWENSWRTGGPARTTPSLSSFDFVDEILRKLANKATFPNMKAIVVAGHSAGGQFANRYEMSNKIHDTLGVPITYVVANPSSYAYLDPTRPAAADNGATTFRAFGDARNCTTYDNWPYGIQNRTGYAARVTADQLKKQLAARPTTYLVGELDTLPLAGFDSSCPAMAQGANRNLRGQAWGKYVNEKFAAHHATMVVPLCGHNARCMFTNDNVLALIFPKP